jgi:hypothetical protein
MVACTSEDGMLLDSVVAVAAAVVLTDRRFGCPASPAALNASVTHFK